MRICVDFQGIGMDFENFRAETSGKTLKLFMRIPRKFIDPNRVDGELAAVLNNRDTIVSAQREMTNIFYRQSAMMVISGVPPKLWLFHLRWKVSSSSSQSGAMAVKLFSPN